MTDRLIVEQDDRVRVLTLNRPERYNALDATLRRDIVAALHEAGENDGVRAVVVTGTGRRAFCAGQDLSESAELDTEAGPAWMADWNAYFSTFATFNKPIVAAVNGVAAGAGFETALLSHIRLASQDARFVMAEVDVGLPAIVGGALLAMHLGQARTTDLVLTGRQMSAEEMRACGLLRDIVPPADLVQAAVETARELAAKPRVATRLNLERFSGSLAAGLARAQQAASIYHPQAVASGQPQEAMRDFLASRAARRDAHPRQTHQKATGTDNG